MRFYNDFYLNLIINRKNTSQRVKIKIKKQRKKNKEKVKLMSTFCVFTNFESK